MIQRLNIRRAALAGVLCSMTAAIGAFPAWGQGSAKHDWKSGFVTATDSVKIHYVEAGTKNGGNSVLFVPGWVMPAWIWEKQIEALSKTHRVVAMDPRSQGESEKTTEGLYPAQMARDIRSLIEQLHLAPVVIVGWSMAVVETMAYVDQFGTKDVAGLVLVDELAGGQEPGDAEMDWGVVKGILEEREKTTDYFVRKIEFHKPHPEDYIQRVIAAALETPTSDAVALLAGRYTADYRSVLPKIDKPTLVCAARSPYFDRVVAMQKQIAGSRLEVFEGAGHALFVDNAEQFNTAMESFLSGLK
ncbi:MAG TPA: alpha/beta hydrolase [Verrucomicrobiae bacterium]|nr:alpha/beta hydrolase [Verrucomicrobiae bacterium]